LSGNCFIVQFSLCNPYTKGGVMYEVGGEEIQTVTMDHHGLVAAVGQDLGIASKIDKKLGPFDERRIVTPGTAVMAMILNGLGFTNRRLYLTHQFFENKPIEKLLNADVKAEDITDYTLGHALDEIADYGASKLFGEVAFEIALSNDLLGMKNHLDTTSFSVHGQYEVDDAAEVIEVTHGHSKDHRPDLKQVVLSLVVNGPSSIPLWMETLDGNSSDKRSFHETIKNVQSFQKQIKCDNDFKWLADSALYSKEKLLRANDYLWVCRVPETINEAKKLVEKSNDMIDWTEQEKGYRTSEFASEYGDIKQRWILVYSEQAYYREKKTLENKLKKQSDQLEKELWHLGNNQFSCEKDAVSAIDKIRKRYKYFDIDYQIKSIEKFEKRGRPLPGDEKIVVGYEIVSTYFRNEELILKHLNTKGRFILATNDHDKENYSAEKILTEYKEQQNVEGGFRFLKDPWFMVDSIFLKTPKRIEALMMVMTLCLLVYNVAQYKLRKKLKEDDATIPNQLNKPVKNPTMRWIFQLMEGISIVRFFRKNLNEICREIITNLSDLRKKIIQFFGQTACQIYGLIVENRAEVLGM
jgi:transposase